MSCLNFAELDRLMVKADNGLTETTFIMGTEQWRPIERLNRKNRTITLYGLRSRHKKAGANKREIRLLTSVDAKDLRQCAMPASVVATVPVGFKVTIEQAKPGLPHLAICEYEGRFTRSANKYRSVAQEEAVRLMVEQISKDAQS